MFCNGLIKFPVFRTNYFYFRSFINIRFFIFFRIFVIVVIFFFKLIYYIFVWLSFINDSLFISTFWATVSIPINYVSTGISSKFSMLWTNYSYFRRNYSFPIINDIFIFSCGQRESRLRSDCEIYLQPSGNAACPDIGCS